jgi:DNA-binding XRE family transcriptional regulator
VTGEEFQKERKRLRLTKVDLAERLGVTETTIYRWENDLAPISKVVELAMKQVARELATGENS